MPEFNQQDYVEKDIGSGTGFHIGLTANYEIFIKIKFWY